MRLSIIIAIAFVLLIPTTVFAQPIDRCANLNAGALLMNCDLHGMDLSNKVLSDAILSGANLSNADLSGADLSRADLSGADLSYADLSSADLSYADLSYADLSSADLSNADLSSADLSGADLSNVNLNNADLSYADLSGADLSGYDLSDVNFSGADLSRADLSNANLSGAELSGSLFAITDLSNADLSGADLSGADLSDVNLSNADLRGADLSYADLSKTGLFSSGADLSGADLSGANIYSTNFGGIDIDNIIGLDEAVYNANPIENNKNDYSKNSDESQTNFLDKVKCGIGTMLKDGQCVVDTNYKTPEPTCGAGTELKDGICQIIKIDESATNDLNYKTYQNNGFSIDYPSGWIFDDSQNFEDYGVSFFNEDEWTSVIQVFFYENNDLTEDNIEELKTVEENYCQTSSFELDGRICYDFEIITEGVFEDSSGHETFLITYYYVDNYGDVDFSIPYPMIGSTYSVIDGNNVWQIVSDTDAEEFEFYHDDITNSMLSFKILPNTKDWNDSQSNFMINDDEEPEVIEEKQGDDGGCLIATATYGSEMATEVQQLRELRDNTLLQTESGTAFMQYFNDFYYSFSPYIADYERENPVFKEMVKIAITPMIASLSILNYVDMNSEESVLGYGISLILLNVGMYVGVPAVVIIGIRKRF